MTSEFQDNDSKENDKVRPSSVLEKHGGGIKDPSSESRRKTLSDTRKESGREVRRPSGTENPQGVPEAPQAPVRDIKCEGFPKGNSSLSKRGM